MPCQYSANEILLALWHRLVRVKKADRPIVYDARLTFKGNGKVIHRESKTFRAKSVAQAWLNRT